MTSTQAEPQGDATSPSCAQAVPVIAAVDERLDIVPARVEPVGRLVERVDRLAEDRPADREHEVQDDRQRRVHEHQAEGDAAEHADAARTARRGRARRAPRSQLAAGDQVADRGGEQAGDGAASASTTAASTLAAITRSRSGTSANVVSPVRCDHSLVTSRMPSTGSRIETTHSVPWKSG